MIIADHITNRPRFRTLHPRLVLAKAFMVMLPCRIAHSKRRDSIAQRTPAAPTTTIATTNTITIFIHHHGHSSRPFLTTAQTISLLQERRGSCGARQVQLCTRARSCLSPPARRKRCSIRSYPFRQPMGVAISAGGRSSQWPTQSWNVLASPWRWCTCSTSLSGSTASCRGRSPRSTGIAKRGPCWAATPTAPPNPTYPSTLATLSLRVAHKLSCVALLPWRNREAWCCVSRATRNARTCSQK